MCENNVIAVTKMTRYELIREKNSLILVP